MGFRIDQRVTIVLDVDGSATTVTGTITKIERMNSHSVKHTFVTADGQEGWIYDDQPVS